LNPDVSVDSLLDVVDRSKTEALPEVERGAVTEAAPKGSDAKPGECWIAAIRLADDTPAAHFIDTVIASRHVLGSIPRRRRNARSNRATRFASALPAEVSSRTRGSPTS
jgi:hypothetical protein